MITPISNNNVNIHVSTRTPQPSNAPAYDSRQTQAATVEISPQALARQADAQMAATAVTSTANATNPQQHAREVRARADEIRQSHLVTQQMHGNFDRPAFYRMGNTSEIFYQFAQNQLGIQDSDERRAFVTNELFGNLYNRDATARTAAILALEHIALTSFDNQEEAAQFIAGVHIVAGLHQLWEQGYFVHNENEAPRRIQDNSTWWNVRNQDEVATERREADVRFTPIDLHHRPETFQNDMVNILTNHGRHDTAQWVQNLFGMAANAPQPPAPPTRPDTPIPPIGELPQQPQQVTINTNERSRWNGDLAMTTGSFWNVMSSGNQAMFSNAQMERENARIALTPVFDT